MTTGELDQAQDPAARLTQAIEQSQARRARRTATRAAFAAARAIGLQRRHSAKLARTHTPTPADPNDTTAAHHKGQTTMINTTGAAVSVPSRAPATDVSEAESPGTVAPAQRSGKRCGYEHREQLHAANKALGKALSTLARDRDPGARQTGARVAAVVAELVAEAASVADDAWSVNRRAAADVARRMPALDRLVAAAREQLGLAPDGSDPVRNP